MKRCGIQRPESFEIVKRELFVLEQFSGPYLVKLLGSDIIQSKTGPGKEALILLEMCPGGHLLDRLLQRNGSPLPIEAAYRIFGQILLGLQPFHQARTPVTHRDLKLENILFGAVRIV